MIYFSTTIYLAFLENMSYRGKIAQASRFPEVRACLQFDGAALSSPGAQFERRLLGDVGGKDNVQKARCLRVLAPAAIHSWESATRGLRRRDEPFILAFTALRTSLLEPFVRFGQKSVFHCNSFCMYHVSTLSFRCRLVPTPQAPFTPSNKCFSPTPSLPYSQRKECV